MKQCTLCKGYFTVDNFYKRKASRDGLQHRCKSCATKIEQQYRSKHPEKYEIKVRNNSTKISCKRVGITVDFLEAYGESIEWYCEICGKDIIYTLHMDHDHSTGKFRGLLCKGCNLGLGNFKDSKELLAKAIEYLEDKHD